MGYIADLFGNKIEKKEQSREDIYKRLLSSAKWRKTRLRKIEEVGNKCEWCGCSGWTRKLEVHHLTYDRLGKERMSDLQVVCKKCHEKADKKRVRDQARLWRKENQKKAYEEGLRTYAAKREGIGREYVSQDDMLFWEDDFRYFIGDEPQ